MEMHLWRPVLLCQFHDVLPGSSIAMVCVCFRDCLCLSGFEPSQRAPSPLWQVHNDAAAIQLRAATDLLQLLTRACAAMTQAATGTAVLDSCFSGSLCDAVTPAPAGGAPLPAAWITGWNLLGVPRREIVAVPAHWAQGSPPAQLSHDGRVLLLARAGQFGAVTADPAPPAEPVTVTEAPGSLSRALCLCHLRTLPPPAPSQMCGPFPTA